MVPKRKIPKWFWPAIAGILVGGFAMWVAFIWGVSLLLKYFGWL